MDAAAHFHQVGHISLLFVCLAFWILLDSLPEGVAPTPRLLCYVNLVTLFRIGDANVKFLAQGCSRSLLGAVVRTDNCTITIQKADLQACIFSLFAVILYACCIVFQVGISAHSCQAAPSQQLGLIQLFLGCSLCICQGRMS